MASGARAAEALRATFTNSIKDVPAGSLLPAELTAAEAASTMEFMVALKMRDLPGLQARIAKGEIIPPEEMAAKYYPLKADYRASLDWLTGQGLTITQTDPCQLGIFVSGSVDLIKKSLQTSVAKVSANGKTYIAAVTAPSLPASLAAAVLGINGLQPHIQPHSHLRKASAQTPNAPPFLPSEILKAYDANGLGLTGAGQKIAIVIDTFPANSDLTQFWTEAGVSQSTNNMEYVNVLNSRHLPNPSGEESLDAEWSSSIAPGAKVRVYATKDLTFAHIDQAYQAIINDLPTQPALHQVSCSFGAGEAQVSSSQLQTDAQYFASMAGSGVSVFVSTGDDGYNPNGMIQCETPSSDPSVTGVGGTSVYLDSVTGAVSSESAWSGHYPNSGTGGGVSVQFSRPAWQTGTGVPAGTMRVCPDVSAPADPNTGALVVLGGKDKQYGGTSWSAPTWAGFCALLNQARANSGLQPLGLLGPRIYPLLGTANFRDITTGSNGYNAGPGFDLCTGIGVPNVAALTQTFTTPPPVISSATTASGTVGTAFSYQITASNSPTSYNATPLPAGLTVNTNTGAITGTPTTAGTTSVTISATNAGDTGSATLTITVTKATPTITWANPADIVYGTALGVTQLNATASVPGGLTYTPAAGTVLSVGNGQTLHVDFVPTDTANYTNASKDVAINVTKATPVITWANPADIVYGTALGNTQLNATASVPGVLTYTPAAGTVLSVGNGQALHVDFVPTDTANYSNASKSATINVTKLTPTLTWATPADIVYGTALGAAQLNATASVPGVLTYTPAAGTVLNVGNGQSLHVDFVPTDTVNYNNASKDVQIGVVGVSTTARETQDTNGNGHIDAIRIVTNVPLNDNFAGLQITVAGYTVASYETGASANDTEFFVRLVEGATPDTDATPGVQVVAGGSLGLALDAAPVTPTDKAKPVLMSASWNDGSGAGVGANDPIYLTFSEPVTNNHALASDFGLPVANDTYGNGASVSVSQDPRQLMLTLQSDPLLTPGGVYSPGTLTFGSPTGIYVNLGGRIADLAAAPNTALNQAIGTAVDLAPAEVNVSICWADDLSIAPRDWNIDPAHYGVTYQAFSYFSGPPYNLPNGLVARNNGNVWEKFTVNCSTSYPAGWAVATAAGQNQFELKVATSGPPYPAPPYPLDLANGPQVIATQLYSGHNQSFDLQFTSPTAGTTGVGAGQTIFVTITATQD